MHTFEFSRVFIKVKLKCFTAVQLTNSFENVNHDRIVLCCGVTLRYVELSIVLCCVVLCYVEFVFVLCCAMLCCVVLCCVVLHCVVLCCVVLRFVVCFVLRCVVVLCCVVLCCVVLCCVVLCCAVLCRVVVLCCARVLCRDKLNNIFLVNHFFLIVPLGSVPELTAESCKEIKASEGQAVSSKYWLSSIKPDIPVLAHCDMETEGEFYNSNFYLLFSMSLSLIAF